jgi:hypothetical protein
MRTDYVSVTYDQIRDQLDTFDLVLWSSGDKFAHLIQIATISKWTHVGMIVRFPGDVLMLWESTFDDNHSGVRLTPLSKAITEEVAIRKCSVTRTAERWNRLMAVRKELDGRPFEDKVLEFICAAYDGPFGGNKRNITALFCSELIAETYQRVGLLDSTLPSNEYTPNDFSSTASSGLLLLNGAKLSDETYVSPAVVVQSVREFNTSKLPRSIGTMIKA